MSTWNKFPTSGTNKVPGLILSYDSVGKNGVAGLPVKVQSSSKQEAKAKWFFIVPVSSAADRRKQFISLQVRVSELQNNRKYAIFYFVSTIYWTYRDR